MRKWEYLSFREKGIAYAIHSNEESHRIFNFSLLDYVEGIKKKGRDLCEVLGYWGDITISPFWTFGFTVDTLEEYKEYYKKRNHKYYYYNEKFVENFVKKMISNFQENFE